MATEKKSFSFPDQLPKIAEVVANPKSPNRVVLNGQNYLFAMFLESSSPEFGESGYREIPHSIVEKLVINDHLLSFKLNGYVEIKNENYTATNYIASIINKFTDEKCVTEETSTDYHFESSGTERLHLKFTPIDEIVNTDAKSIPNYSKSDQHLIMFSFFVTKVEDKGRSLLLEKRIRIHFQDVESRSLEMIPINNWDSSKVGNREGGSNLPTYPISDNDLIIEDEASSKWDEIASAYQQSIKTKTTVTNSKWDEIASAYKDYQQSLIPKTTITTNTSYKACKTGEGIYDCLKLAFEKTDSSIPNLNLKARLPEVTSTGSYSIVKGKVNPTQYNRKQWKRSKSSQESYESSPRGYSPYDTWDFGAFTSLLYVSDVKKEGVKVYARDILDEHLKYHVSGQEHNPEDPSRYSNTEVALDCDPCILKLNKPRGEREYPYITLRSFDNYFENVVNNHKYSTIYEGWMGEFNFEESFDNLSILKHFTNRISDTVCPDEESHTTKGGIIKAFKFNKMKSKDSTKYINSHHVEYTGKDREYYYNGYDGDYSNVMKYMGEKYIKRFIPPETYINSDQGSKLIKSGDVDGVKKENKNVIKVVNPIETVVSSVAIGRNRLIKYVVFLSDSLVFSTTGNTAYSSGQMFKASLLNNDNNSDLVNDMNGFYWASRVQHIINFDDKTYANEIVGQKFYKSGLSERQKKVVVESTQNSNESSQEKVQKDVE